jgi:hypothetical protein
MKNKEKSLKLLDIKTHCDGGHENILTINKYTNFELHQTQPCAYFQTLKPSRILKKEESYHGRSTTNIPTLNKH